MNIQTKGRLSCFQRNEYLTYESGAVASTVSIGFFFYSPRRRGMSFEFLVTRSVIFIYMHFSYFSVTYIFTGRQNQVGNMTLSFI